MSPFVQQLIGSFIGTSLAMLLVVAGLVLIERRDSAKRRRERDQGPDRS